jgi:hypothetical protein
MADKKKNNDGQSQEDVKNTIPAKSIWNLYSLQKLSINKFIKILDKVFKNETKLTK